MDWRERFPVKAREPGEAGMPGEREPLFETWAMRRPSPEILPREAMVMPLVAEREPED